MFGSQTVDLFVGPTFLEHASHGLQRLTTDVVFNAFTVHGSRFFTDTQLAQKLLNDFVTVLRTRCKSATSTGQLNRLVRFGRNISVPLQPHDVVVHRRVRDVEMPNQIGRFADTTFIDRLGNRLHIVLGNLGRVITTGPIVIGG